MKVALLETIEALVSAIKSKFLTKTEAESIYQPKASAINTGNIGSQSVSYASSAYSASNADEANELHGRATFNSQFPSQGQGSLRYYISASNYDGQPPADGAILYMGASGGHGKDHQAAFGDDGELYIKHMSDGTWQPWTRMAKASEIPSVSGFATEDWVTSNYYNLQEMNDNYYNAGDIDSMLDNYLPKRGGTVTGPLTTKDIILTRMMFARSKSEPIVQFWTRSNGNKEHNFGRGADIITLNAWFELTKDKLYYIGDIHTEKSLRINKISLIFDPTTNTLNFKGVDGQTVYIAVNGKVIA